jgi:hypothetical protein
MLSRVRGTGAWGWNRGFGMPRMATLLVLLSPLSLLAQPALGMAAPFGLSTARVMDEAFELELRPVGTYKAGKLGAAQVVLKPRGGFKVNDKYPYKFEFAKLDGIKPLTEQVSSDSLELSRERAVMTLRFTPLATGQATVAGQFRFSVCTDDRCLVERQELALSVRVE